MPFQRHAILNVVGLSTGLLGENTPCINKWASKHETTSFPPVFPALTCSAQATYLTGKLPEQHGIVGNGWYDRDYAEPRFWKQSNRLVQGDKIWEQLRKNNPNFTCAKIFWWYNMYSSANWSVTPRPLYLADGGKVFDIHTHPLDLRPELKKHLGEFPFPTFWGPKAGLPSTEWIANCARYIEKQHQPSLSLVYLPHLDYCLQKHGPNSAQSAKELHQLDALLGELLAWYEQQNIQPIILSEYGISPVDNPIHINRIFRKKQWLSIKDELGRETLDYGACQALAIPDHQIAHIYLHNPNLQEQVIQLLGNTKGIAKVIPSPYTPDTAASHRAGDLIAIADEKSWFTYYYWEDDAKAPDFARTIDIHRKPGYDPAELFIDPKMRLKHLKIANFLMRKKLGFRTLLDIIPLDATLVKGSHGLQDIPKTEQPLLIGPNTSFINSAQDIHPYLLNLLKTAPSS